MSELQRTPLFQSHVSSGARMVPFAGWEMPVQYTGIIPEVNAVRSGVGIFDISHMGQLMLTGSGSRRTLDSLCTNDVSRLEDGQGQYTLLLNETGGVIDDLIVYRCTADRWFLVVNASRIDEDFAWIQKHLSSDAALSNLSADTAGLAVQGPEAAQLFSNLTGLTLPERFCLAEHELSGGSVTICRTGYTGEDGFELFCSASQAADWWQQLTGAGAVPCGLGARDLLRLEMCYPLNGSDLLRDRTPLEAGLGWACALDRESEFIGKSVLTQQKAEGVSHRLVALRMTEKSPPPRHGYPVLADDTEVGIVTSGGHSPTVDCGIALAYVRAPHAARGTTLQIQIRNRSFACEVVKKPFLSKSSA